MTGPSQFWPDLMEKTMGYDLNNVNGESTGFNSPMWNALLWIGKNWGWEPEGTYKLKDEDAYWDHGILEAGTPFGVYTGNDAKVVTAEDAGAWAAALESAIGDRNFSATVTAWHNEVKSSYQKAADGLTEVVLRDFKEDEYRSAIMDFISFLRKGSFVIT